MAKTYKTGAASKDAPPNDALRIAWQTALDADRDKAVQGGRWVPKLAILVDDAISPRTSGVRAEVVEAYAGILDDLPPLTVERDTFRLIDGWHRLAAAFTAEAATDIVRVVEVDVVDPREAAFEANLRHGVPLTLDERVAHMRYLLRAMPDASDGEIARRAGISRVTVWRTRQRDEQAADARAAAKREPKAEPKAKPAAKSGAKSEPVVVPDPEDEAIASLTSPNAAETPKTPKRSDTPLAAETGDAGAPGNAWAANPAGAWPEPGVKRICEAIRTLATVGTPPREFFAECGPDAKATIRHHAGPAFDWLDGLYRQAQK